jgi:hypothetical protein
MLAVETAYWRVGSGVTASVSTMALIGGLILGAMSVMI